MHHAVTETMIQAHEAPTNAPAMLRVTVNENPIAKASVPNAPLLAFFPKASAAYWREPSGNGEDPRIARNEAFMCWCGRPLIPPV